MIIRKKDALIVDCDEGITKKGTKKQTRERLACLLKHKVCYFFLFEIGRLGVFQQLLRLVYGRFAEFAIYLACAFDELFEFLEGCFCCFEGFALTAVFFVRKILGECGSGTAEAEAPALECCGFVCETR